MNTRTCELITHEQLMENDTVLKFCVGNFNVITQLSSL